MIGQTISHYKIIEKLGEGGMGVVYKAQDTTLNRVIALKFLPDRVNKDETSKARFLQEAQAVAGLNHPHICTIFGIEEFEGQLYMAMEYVEGGTLAEKIPFAKIDDAITIASQIGDALQEAHTKGIVHRDIKADNIMLTPKGQAKVMDFGLAKLKGAMKLTRTSSTVGTLGYMAPEQIQGGEVDHRSDIFSFGVLLFEMLTGKLPFRGEHEAAMVYSIVNEEPQNIAQLIPDLSPIVVNLIQRCLEKEASERYQHFDDITADLKRALRKTSRVMKSSPGIQQSLSEERISATHQATVEQPKKKITWFVVPIAAIVLLIVLFFIFNPFKLQVTQEQSAGSTANSLAVMYFENIPDPEDKDHTGEMLTDLLITALSQAKGLEVISRERLYDIQKELGQTDSKSITPSTATKVAQRAGVTTMLLGSILQHEPSLAITARLIDVKTGKILSSQRITGFSSAQIFALIDTLALLVRNDLHVTPDASTETKSVAEVTTKSPEAYRSYIEGVELNKKFYVPEAKAAFRKAIELDSNFAMAYFNLANLAFGVDAEESRRLVTKAWELKENTNERERLSIHAEYVSRVENDLNKSIEIYETIIQKYPREQNIYIALGIAYAILRQPEKSVQTYRRGLAVDSLHKNLWNILAYGNLTPGKKRDALYAIDRYLQIAPAEPNPYDSKGDIYFGFGDLDSAEIWWQKALSFRADFPSGSKIALIRLIQRKYDEGENINRQFASGDSELEEYWVNIYSILVSSYKGQLTSSIQQLDALIPSLKKIKKYDLIAGCYLYKAMIFYEQGNYPGMLEAMKKRTTEIPDHQSKPMYDRELLAFAYIKNGKKDAAAQVIREIERDIPNPRPIEQSKLDYYAALLAYEEGNYDEAVKWFNRSLQSQGYVHSPQFFYAVSLLKSGHTAEVIEELQRATWWVYFGNVFYDMDYLGASFYYIPISTAKAHYWLGVAYEQQGKKELAMKEYELFLTIWKDSDFRSKEKDDATSRLAKLKGIVSK